MRMLDQVIKRICPLLGSMLAIIAVYVGVKPASLFAFYQIKAPKCLK